MIYIPKKIKVGYCNRPDTYTGKLAYVIYYDERGKLRKEPSWESWRDDSIEPDEYDNLPIEGFVLNKKVGGTNWHGNLRQTYTRVYDPRGFEFEITVPNLLYILEHVSSIRGKGLEGEFVYGWDGADLVLVPTSAPEYQKRNETVRKLFHDSSEYLKPSEIKPGFEYHTNTKTIVYMGRFTKYTYKGEDLGLHHFFYEKVTYENGRVSWYLCTRTSLSKFALKDPEGILSEIYEELLDRLESDYSYSPIDFDHPKYLPMSFDEFKQKMGPYGCTSLVGTDKKRYGFHLLDGEPYVYTSSFDRWGMCKWGVGEKVSSLREVFDAIQPIKKVTYLMTGKVFKEEYYGFNQ